MKDMYASAPPGRVDLSGPRFIVLVEEDEPTSIAAALRGEIDASPDSGEAGAAGIDRDRYLAVLKDVEDILNRVGRPPLPRALRREPPRPEPGAPLEAPSVSELAALGLEIVPRPDYVKVIARADDGSHVEVHWDESDRSAGVYWEQNGRGRAMIGRQELTRVRVVQEDDCLAFWIWAGKPGAETRVIVRVGEDVSIKDQTMLPE